jgi:hypothetical protein
MSGSSNWRNVGLWYGNGIGATNGALHTTWVVFGVCGGGVPAVDDEANELQVSVGDGGSGKAMRLRFTANNTEYSRSG